jgi:hypothetical protein
VRIPQDGRFREERARFSLRFCCEDCALFDPERVECAHGYPVEEHRRARYEDPDAEIVFCKDWDLV